jgi:hypothetical protein
MKTSPISKYFLIAFTLGIILATTPFVFAENPPSTASQNGIGYVPLAPIPGTESSPGKTAVTFTSYVSGLYTFLIAGSIVLTILMIIWGGFTYLSTDAIYGKEEGRKIINQALLGLLLVLGSWIILNQINPNLVNFELNLKIDKGTTSNTPQPNPTPTP